jgi:cyclopropane fatty-acyl-phospholipid synthase-like methyltransferase
MERAKWLKQMRDNAEALYDHVSPEYWVKYGLYANTSHQHYLQKFLELVPSNSTLLSAACGAGRYDGMLLEAGHNVLGVDQSSGMLARAKERFPKAQYQKLGLQEMDFHEAFEGTICMDAMEHVCPEDWPLVLRNFHRALKPNGYLYTTVEIAPEEEVEAAFRQGQEMGLPVVYGEWANNDDVYHYYPSLSQVREWLRQTGFSVVEEGEGDGYHHFVSRKET